MNSVETKTVASMYAALEFALGNQPKAIRSILNTYSNIREAFSSLTSDPVQARLVQEGLEKASRKIDDLGNNVKIILKGTEEYPKSLLSWSTSPEVLYVKGNPKLLHINSVSVVGSRAASDEGKIRAAKLAKLLCENNFCVTSGLALGIDTAAHTGALRAGGNTLAVIGTPIDQYYPKENKQLQDFIVEHGAVVSQFSPIKPTQRFNFPARNELMSALSLATVIVEAGETSGALTQAAHCLKQGKPLFIMQNQIERNDLQWPKNFLKKGAISLKSFDDLIIGLDKLSHARNDQDKQLKLV